jgi:hypothetical protein
MREFIERPREREPDRIYAALYDRGDPGSVQLIEEVAHRLDTRAEVMTASDGACLVVKYRPAGGDIDYEVVADGHYLCAFQYGEWLHSYSAEVFEQTHIEVDWTT